MNLMNFIKLKMMIINSKRNKKIKKNYLNALNRMFKNDQNMIKNKTKNVQ